MSVLLESATHNDIREAMEWGFVAGILTDPILLAAAGDVSLDALKPLCQLAPGQVFFPLTSHDLSGLLLEAQAVFTVSPSQVVLLAPANLEGIRAAARLSLEIPCAVGPIGSPAQAWLAREAGAKYVVLYMNWATRSLGDGSALVAEVVKVLDGSSTEVVVGDIPSAADATKALAAGAPHLALRTALLKEMASHPLSEQILAEFGRALD